MQVISWTPMLLAARNNSDDTPDRPGAVCFFIAFTALAIACSVTSSVRLSTLSPSSNSFGFSSFRSRSKYFLHLSWICFSSTRMLPQLSFMNFAPVISCLSLCICFVALNNFNCPSCVSMFWHHSFQAAVFATPTASFAAFDFSL